MSYIYVTEPEIGIRNFIVGIIVKVSSDESSLRKEKSYVNKLNLALVQVRLLPYMLVFVLICWLDFEARVAAQLANFHS